MLNNLNHDLVLLLQRINEALEHLEQHMQALPDGDIGRDLYTQYQQRFVHIQSLFDRGADLLHDSSIDPSNPAHYPLLERKEDMNKYYGRYRRLYNRFMRLYARDERSHDAQERERSFAAPPADLPEEEELQQDEVIPLAQEELLAEDLLAEWEEEAAEKAKQEKKRTDRQRQEALTRAGKERESEFGKQDAAQQELRRQEAARMAVHTTPEHLYSEADLRNERLRQDDEQLRLEREAQLRHARNQEMVDSYHQRMDGKEGYDWDQKGHFDFSAQPSEHAPDTAPIDHSSRQEPSPYAERPYPTFQQPSGTDMGVPPSHSEASPYDSPSERAIPERDSHAPYPHTQATDSPSYATQIPPGYPSPFDAPRQESSFTQSQSNQAPPNPEHPSQQYTVPHRGSEYDPIPLHSEPLRPQSPRDPDTAQYHAPEPFRSDTSPSEPQYRPPRGPEPDVRYQIDLNRPAEYHPVAPPIPQTESAQFAKPEQSAPYHPSYQEPSHRPEAAPMYAEPRPQDPVFADRPHPYGPIPLSQHSGVLPYAAAVHDWSGTDFPPKEAPVIPHQSTPSRAADAPKYAEPFVPPHRETVSSQDAPPKRPEPQPQSPSYPDTKAPYGPISFSQHEGPLPYATSRHRADPNLPPKEDVPSSRQAPQSGGVNVPKDTVPFVSSYRETAYAQNTPPKHPEPQPQSPASPDTREPYGPIPFSKHHGELPYAAAFHRPTASEVPPNADFRQDPQSRKEESASHTDPAQTRREARHVPPEHSSSSHGNSNPQERAEAHTSAGDTPRQYKPHSVPDPGKPYDPQQKGGGAPPSGTPKGRPSPEPQDPSAPPRTLFRYVPSGVAEQQLTPPRPVSLAERREDVLSKSDNHKIYAAIKAGMPSQSDRPHTISPAYETQMQYNLESAKLQYRQLRGTSGASAAAHTYMEQRKAYMALKADIKEGRLQLAPTSVLDPKSASHQAPEPKQPKSSGTQYFYTPKGLYGRLIENAQVTGSQCQVSQVGKPAPFAYTAINPLVVSPAYEAALKSRADRASVAVNHAVATSKVSGRTLRFHPTVNAEVALATTAYLGFQRAKQSGQVIISKDASQQVPDFSLWSQRYVNGGSGTGPRRTVDSGKVPGTTGQSKGPNPNKVTKQEVEEKVANIFGKSTKLKRETLITQYGKSLGYKMESYGTIALSRISRKLYYMAQSGNEDGPETIRTFEQGRYYLKTAVDVRRALKNLHVVDSKGAAKAGTKRESALYRKYASMSKKELSQLTHQKIQDNRVLKREIKELWKKGFALTAEERKELLRKTAKLAVSSREVSLAVGYQKLHRKNDLAVKAAQDMEARRHLLTKPGQIDEVIKEIRTKGEKKIVKKFGKELTALKDKSLKKQADLLKQQGRELKEQIKLLQSKGSALTHSERKYLLSLMKKHATLNEEIRKYTGLLAARAKLNSQLAPYMALRKSIIKNTQALGSGLYALHSILLKPIREGSEVGAQGLAKGAQIVANRHVRAVVKKTVKAEYAVGRWAVKKTHLDIVAKKAVHKTATAVANTKTAQAVKTGVQTSSAAIKTAVAAGKTTAVNLTPTFIKTGVQKTVLKQNLLRSRINRLKDRVANSTFGRAYAAVRRTFSKFTQGIRTALSFIKGFLIKAGLAVLGFILIFGLVVGIIEVITTAASSIIMAPGTSDGGKIDLSPYVEILKEEQGRFESEIKAIKDNPDYDKVVIEYLTPTEDNSREMLSMMAVRMSQDLDMSSNPEVEPYLRSLFNDSHYYTTKKINYQCSGCKTRTVKGDCDAECPQDCEEDHSYEETYCDGHIRVDVNVSILSFDELFTADTLGNAEGNAKQGSLIGHATVTYYCAEKYPHICNAGPPYKTAMGTTPTPGRTIAVDKNRIPLGTHVIIDGHEYVAEDTGGAIDALDIDIVVATHAQALAKGKRYNVPVYRVVYEGEGIQDSGEWNGWTEDNIEWCKAICYADWSDLYDGIDGIADIVGLDTDLSGVKFIDGERKGNEEIVDIALSQVGNVGGRPYWSWYGFNSRVEWCATFVSWCAYKDGSLDSSVPKFAACQTQGVPWFKNRGQWAARGDITPVAGDIIFFDWEPNASANHVGIVVGTDGTKVYTVEGNSSDRVRTKSYPLDSPYILGYGIPNY